MNENNWRACAMMGFVISGQIVAMLYRAGKITREEASEIYDQALLIMETNQALAGESQAPIILARQMADIALGELSAPRKSPE